MDNDPNSFMNRLDHDLRRRARDELDNEIERSRIAQQGIARGRERREANSPSASISSSYYETPLTLAQRRWNVVCSIIGGLGILFFICATAILAWSSNKNSLPGSIGGDATLYLLIYSSSGCLVFYIFSFFYKGRILTPARSKVANGILWVSTLLVLPLGFALGVSLMIELQKNFLHGLASTTPAVFGHADFLLLLQRLNLNAGAVILPVLSLTVLDWVARLFLVSR